MYFVTKDSIWKTVGLLPAMQSWLSWELLGISSWEVKDHLKKEPSLLYSVGDSSREKISQRDLQSSSSLVPDYLNSCNLEADETQLRLLGWKLSHLVLVYRAGVYAGLGV